MNERRSAIPMPPVYSESGKLGLHRHDVGRRHNIEVPDCCSYGELTKRELDVLRLLAEGLTNDQIAERLVLSKHTVHAHLHSIYGKLNIGTRSAATRYALEHMLA